MTVGPRRINFEPVRRRVDVRPGRQFEYENSEQVVCSFRDIEFGIYRSYDGAPPSSISTCSILHVREDDRPPRSDAYLTVRSGGYFAVPVGHRPRIATLNDYFQRCATYLLVPLLPEDAETLSEEYERISEI